MCLRSFSFGAYMGVNGLPVEVLALFNALADCPEKRIDFASEIIQAALQGKIDLSGSFNIDAYETAIRRNSFLVKIGERKKKLYLDRGSYDDDFSETGCINTEHLSLDCVSCMAEVKDAFEDLLDESELNYAVSMIKKINNKVVAIYGVDLIHAIRQAIKGFHQSIEAVKNLCLSCKPISDLVETVLSSDKEFDALFD